MCQTKEELVILSWITREIRKNEEIFSFDAIFVNRNTPATPPMGRERFVKSARHRERDVA
jgi:hypothetical protein